MMGNKSFVFRFADVEVREREFSLIKAAEALPVEPKAFRVLLLLLRNPQKLITKEELLNAVWGDVAVGDNSLARSIALLRRLLGDDTRNPRYIETVATVGYRFLGNVEVVEDPTVVPMAPDPPSAATSGTPGAADPTSPVAKEPTKRRYSPVGLLAVGAVVAILLAIVIWYLTRPLPPPLVTAYNQITHDGHIWSIAGTDGSRIYFNAYTWGPVEQVGVTGGGIVGVPTGSTHVQARDVSADGASLLIWTLDTVRLWTMGTLGGSPRLIADASGQCNHKWSPDAKYIAYSDCHGNLLAMRSEGTEVRKLVTVKDDITDIAWSPDGGRIRFTVDNALWEITAAGGNLHPVLPNWKGPVGQCCGRWTPDGDFYLFLAGGNNYNGAIVGFEQMWILDERYPLFRRVSRTPLPLTSGPIHWDVPIPSRDRRKIFAVGTIPRGELVRFDPTSKRLQPFLGGISAESLAYSKDGAEIAYVTFPDGILWRAKADGTERVQLTSPPLYPLVAHWSPDGSQILFFAQRDRSQYALYVVPAQGGTPRLLISGDDGQAQVDGTWSPDGRRVLYHIYPQQSLRIFDLDSGKVTDVPGSNGLSSPRWSPDGRYFAAMTSPAITIRLFDTQTQQWSTLVEHMGGWGFPTWSRDSKFIYALNGPGPWSVYRLAVPGGTPQRVVDLSDVPLIGALGYWFGLDPDDTPLLLRNNGSSDIYALTLEEK